MMFNPDPGVERQRLLDRIPLGAVVIGGAVLAICLIWYGLLHRVGSEESKGISRAALEDLNYVLAFAASAILMLGSIAIALLFRRQKQLHRGLRASKIQAEELLSRNLKAVDDLTQSERRFRDLAELSSDWFWEQDADLRFTVLSADYRHKRVLETGRIIGKQRWELPAVGVTDEQWREHRGQLERRESFYDFAYQLLGEDGEMQWHSVSGKPVFGPNGDFLGYRGTGSNITARKQAEQALLDSRERLEAAERIAEMGSWQVRLPENLISWSEGHYHLFGVARTEFDPTYGNFIKCIHPEDRESTRVALRQLYENREPAQISYRILRPDGAVRHIVSRGRVVLDADGTPLQMIGASMDITERMHTEATIRELNQSLELLVARRTEELERLNRDLESFSYSVSHDLRAPLRAINGFAALLNKSEREALTPDGRKLLERVGANATKMGTLIDEMLNFSRISRAKMSRAPLNLNNLVNEVLQELRDVNPAAEITVGPLSQASGDRPMLRQALANLIGNALKFTSKSEKPMVEIGASMSEEGQVYFIRDNGVGFDPRYAGKLFNPFQRLHRESEFPGTGIGLVIVKQIIERHGGRVWAHSTVGQGAEFFFTLGNA